ncbi:MAG: hypothetical protein R3200_04350 [Xanthomonadales bacterium]|nr:hypothetical protein [Xanthomonadales bacterium]
MSDDKHEPTNEPEKEQSQEPPEPAREAAGGYVAHVFSVLTRPDTVFDADHRIGKTNALIDVCGFLVVFYIAAVVGRTFGYSGFDFEFGHIGHGLKSMLAIGIPIAALLFAQKWEGGRSNGKTSLDFYLEKFGAVLVLPCLLLIIAILLDIIDVRIQSWFRGMALVFVYIGVFGTTYAYAAPGKLKTAAIYLIGFYAVYRLLGLLF